MKNKVWIAAIAIGVVISSATILYAYGSLDFELVGKSSDYGKSDRVVGKIGGKLDATATHKLNVTNKGNSMIRRRRVHCQVFIQNRTKISVDGKLIANSPGTYTFDIYVDRLGAGETRTYKFEVKTDSLLVVKYEIAAAIWMD